MSAPHLTRRLVLEEAHRVPDGAGGFTEVWTALGEVWAEVRAGTGREADLAGTLTRSTTAYRITVRAAPPSSPRRPRPHQRFREGERIFVIRAVADADAGGRYLICHAEEEFVA